MTNKEYTKRLSFYKLTCLALLFITCSVNQLSAQVTIGSSSQPLEGSIVHVKNDKDNLKKGGLLISRVQLNDLQKIPFISDNHPVEQLAALYSQHIGHLVYNIGNKTSNIPEGLYCWDGKIWQLLLTGSISSDGPWYKIESPNEVAQLNDQNAYINAKVVVGSDAVAQLDSQQEASLTISEADASFNDVNFGSGKNNASNSNNIAAGKFALTNNSGVNNSAIGYSALINNSTGNNNVALGANALNQVTTGSQNIAIGNKAGANITTGSKNIAIGNNTLLPDATASSQINIGNALMGCEGAIAIGKTTAATTASLDISKSWIIDNTDKTDKGYVLVVDKNGYVGKSEVAPLMYAYINSTSTQSISNDPVFTANSHDNKVALKWADGDIPESNGIVSLSSDQSSFVVESEFVAQISGYINYIPYASYSTAYVTSRDNASVLLNVAIQLKTSTSDWETITTSRGVWTQAERYGALQSVVIPQVIQTLNKGDQIRLVVIWPNSSSNASTHYGLPHSAGTYNSQVIKQDGVLYSKGLRIISL